ncbi:MAG TPA: hypothetical protein VNM72_02625 [Blastocatellia bacterium]|nr:hypothetical protein [Blastocatellia bacterium]
MRKLGLVPLAAPSLAGERVPAVPEAQRALPSAGATYRRLVRIPRSS